MKVASLIRSTCENENLILRSGFRDLDAIIQGFRESNFVVIGARPSVGKTAFALNIAHNICLEQNLSVGWFTYEMTSKSVTRRLLSMNSGVEYNKLIDNISSLNKSELKAYRKSVSEVSNFSFWINSVWGTDIHELEDKARQMKLNHDVKIIFIDYINLIPVSQDNIPRFEQVAFLSRNIRSLALELGIPIIVVSQVSRSAEVVEPSLATLGESAALQWHADIVIFLHQEREKRKGRNSSKGNDATKVKVIVAKNRNGYIGIANLGFTPKTIKFSN